MKYKEIISEIKSVRLYKKEDVDPGLFKELLEYFDRGKRLFDDIEVEVIRKNRDEVYEQLKDSAGYNNRMIEAPHYLVFLSEEKDYYIENAGYRVQDLMLKAWSLGIASCWITFGDGEEIKKKIGIDSDKKLAALIALGYENPQSKVLYEKGKYNTSSNVLVIEDNTSERLGIRDLVFTNEWGEKADPDELVNYGLLEGFFYGILAPSYKNRQPWRFIVDRGTVVLALKKDIYVTEYEEKIDTAVIMLYFDAIIESTLSGITWKFGRPEKDYKVPDDYKIVAYCLV
ncbi:MAG: nitroreductase family protein [Bacillota bacterium]|jgi:nitroreductase|nr:nitroreductase family protein [Bacillota bacterium]NLL60243.1 nitroreductase [Tissierellia bacterium]